MENRLWYQQEAGAFEEALPIGNGAFGAMVYGRKAKERLSLNLDTLWSGMPHHHSCPEGAELFRKAKQLVLEDRPGEAERMLLGKFYRMWTSHYLPLADLFLEREDSCGDHYVRELALDRGICSASFGGVKNQVFLSNPDGLLVFSETSETPETVTVSLTCQLRHSIRLQDGILILSGRCPCGGGSEWEMPGEAPFLYREDQGVTFTLALKAVTDGRVTEENGTLRIVGAKGFTLYAAACSSYAGHGLPFDGTHENRCLQLLERGAEKGALQLREDHIRDHRALFCRTELELCGESSPLPTDERLRSEHRRSDLGLAELLWAYGKYLTIAASRKGTQATNLQGIWNERLYAPWWSNYAMNINTQMNYWPTLMLGLFECYEPMLSHIKKIADTGRITAKEFYGAEGFCAHCSSDLWGQSTPPGAGHDYAHLYGFWNPASGWMATHLFEYYEYTGDEAFLRDTAYGILKEACRFYLCLLEKLDGEYVLTPTTSPENRYIDADGEEHGIAKKAAMSQAIVKELFLDTAKAAEILGTDGAFRAELLEKAEAMEPHVIGADGRLLEWDREYRELEPQHRHVSHLYGLYPGNQITSDGTPELAAAAKKSLTVRGDAGTGWALSWKIGLWAKLKEGDRALELVYNQLNPVDSAKNTISEEGGTYMNLLDAHPPFQIDGNFGAAAGIMQMLLQYEDGRIRILPALPAKLSRGRFRGLRTKGNVEVSVCWKDGRAEKVTLCSPLTQETAVEIGGVCRRVKLEAGRELTLSGTGEVLPRA